MPMFSSSKTKYESPKSIEDRAVSPTNPTTTVTGGGKEESLAKTSSSSAAKIQDDDECNNCQGRLAFVQYMPSSLSVLVMEIGNTEELLDARYSNKFFRVFVPQVHRDQVDNFLFARKRVGKPKFRFSVEDNAASKWRDSSSAGKVSMVPTDESKKYMIHAGTSGARVEFSIVKQGRKQDLIVKFCPETQSTYKRLQAFRSRSNRSEMNPETYQCVVQKFINPMVDIQCPKTNSTLLKVEKEEAGTTDKFIISYMQPFSLLTRYTQMSKE